MPDALKAVAIILLLLVGYVLLPNQRNGQLYDDQARRIAEFATKTFTDSVRGKGYVDVRDYEVFRKSLDSSGQVFQVTIEHQKKVNQPVYTDPSNPATFQNTFSVQYIGYFNKDILDVLYPGTNLEADDPSRRYKMHTGDLFYVRLKSTSSQLGERLYKVMFKRQEVPIIVLDGGMIRDEAP